jgi:ribosomal protein S18 acetylase RimI-like enzyme
MDASTPLERARTLDLLGARAWPPLEEIRLGGWRLRFAGGVTRRANWVLPLGDGPAPARDGLDRRVDAVERAYAERGLPPRFQLTASAWPEGLAAELLARGYVESDPTLVLTRPVGRRGSGAGVMRHEASEAWFDVWWSVDGRGGAREAEVARGILARIEPQCLFAESHDDDGTAAVALGVVDGEWLGIYCMATLARARRRGHAQALLRRLLDASADLCVTRAHLSVTEENAAAQRLYGAAGFELRQRYRYFTLSPATA